MILGQLQQQFRSFPSFFVNTALCNLFKVRIISSTQQFLQVVQFSTPTKRVCQFSINGLPFMTYSRSNHLEILCHHRILIIRSMLSRAFNHQQKWTRIFCLQQCTNSIANPTTTQQRFTQFRPHFRHIDSRRKLFCTRIIFQIIQQYIQRQFTFPCFIIHSVRFFIQSCTNTHFTNIQRIVIVHASQILHHATFTTTDISRTSCFTFCLNRSQQQQVL
mmetsp:Transcript_10034/g.18075  ORF Transcript_10034/g.18075 Transcript_10034/m.18075 type:complete len:218 (+) Transcript_10034:2684-3337(+)